MTVRLRGAQTAAHDSAIARLRSRRVGVAILLLVTGSAARAATITCPPMLLETPVVNSMLSGWDVDVRAGRRTLADAAIHLSRGSDRGGVAPDATRRAGAQEMSTWTLAPGDGDVYWVACSYGNTSALLLQKVPETARRCVAVHDVLNSGRHLNVRPVECD
jgi:hypothetical protein